MKLLVNSNKGKQNIDTDTVVFVNVSLWKKALSNIIGNAVRHSPFGKDIFISLKSCENRDTLVIENTGVFIPEDDLQHLFTPFYRVDKSRSKATIKEKCHALLSVLYTIGHTV